MHDLSRADLEKLLVVNDTVHNYSIKQTERLLVQNGTSDYKILVPKGQKTEKFIAIATRDLQKFFFESTGVALEVIEDGEADENGKYLSIGKTDLALSLGLDISREALTKAGFIIKTAGDSVVMVGATEEASMYATYAFLQKALRFEQYYTDFYTLDKGVKNLPLYDFDVTDIPDFEYRIQSAGFIRWHDENVRRMRWTDQTTAFIPADEDKMVWHNTFNYLPPDKYKDTHPKWFAEPSITQLCYTAHGDEKEYSLMVETVANRIEELFSMKKYEKFEWITVSIQDNQDGCQCPSCQAAVKKYGAVSGTIVKFLNDVAKRVEAWMQTEEGKPHYRKNFKIFFFAYHATNAAPVRFDAALNRYVPTSDEVICNEHVVPYFAETNGDYMQNLHDNGTANTVVGKNMLGWAALSKEIYFWSYSTNFKYFLIPYNSFDTVQDSLKFAKNNKTVFVMIQDQWMQENAQTGFGIFKNWLHSKLLWDVNADYEALKTQFFDNYFADASPIMREYFDAWQAWARHQTKDLGHQGYRSVYLELADRHLWVKETVLDWYAIVNRAVELINSKKPSDPEYYAEIEKHVRIERIAVQYLLLNVYGYELPIEELQRLKKEFKADVEMSGMNILNTMFHIRRFTDYFKLWGFDEE